MRQTLTALILALLLSLSTAADSWAVGDVLGVHLLSPHDLDQAKQLLSYNQGTKYLTVPLTLSDLDQFALWQRFFDQAGQNQMVPIVRLATKVKGDYWAKPTRWDVVRLFNFLNLLEWPSEKRYVIIFNEVNHAKEWGGQLEPEEYGRILEFASRWAKTEPFDYQVLPAAMDLDAPNSGQTMEAFTFLNRMLAYNPRVFDQVDLWNSHSYPNPGFSSSPTRTGKNSMRGFLHELKFLKQKTGRDFEVMITETGWQANRYTEPWLAKYYLYAAQHIWSLPQVKAVTPFVVQGSPGPFTDFSFFDESSQPTSQFEAFQQAVQAVGDQKAEN
ncbi:MAG: hypothetical protein GF381_03715 [Candidatus Pacebacteria bacterium]|nr:hypothetical protein [Candidatus Paceibacterota bacterium]